MKYDKRKLKSFPYGTGVLNRNYLSQLRLHVIPYTQIYKILYHVTLQLRHNGREVVSIYQPHDCLLNY